MATDHKPKPDDLDVVDEPGMAERFQRGLRNLLNTPPKHGPARAPKLKQRPPSKGRVHKGKTHR
jgi:hypothetical protein